MALETKNLKIDDVLEQVDGDPKVAYQAYKDERDNKGRAKLLNELVDIVAASLPLAAWAEKGQVTDNGARFQIARGNYELFRATEAFSTVEQLFAEADDQGNRVRLDTFDGGVLTVISGALRDAAEELYDSVSNFKSLLALSVMAERQAEAAEKAVEAQQQEAEAEFTDVGVEPAEEDVEVEELVEQVTA